jgi:nitrogen fixation/metabolism regulation signal transduction histidine kinase
MLADFNRYYAAVFAGYLFLYLSFFVMLARVVNTRIVRPVTELTKELLTMKQSSYTRTAANKLASSSGAV